jgi:fatty acid desaturase
MMLHVWTEMTGEVQVHQYVDNQEYRSECDLSDWWGQQFFNELNHHVHHLVLTGQGTLRPMLSTVIGWVYQD